MNNSKLTSDATCPCASGNDYTKCCQQLHFGLRPATTATELMRARFSAFYYGSKNIDANTMADYLAGTQTQVSTQALWLESFKQQTWLGLSVIKQHSKDHQGEVEFAAFYQDANGLGQHHEHSYFEFNGQWQYHSGRFLAPYKYPRNQMCWCQSGKKHKHCHGKS